MWKWFLQLLKYRVYSGSHLVTTSQRLILKSISEIPVMGYIIYRFYGMTNTTFEVFHMNKNIGNFVASRYIYFQYISF